MRKSQIIALFFRWMKDESYLKMIYWIKFKQKLDLKNPKTFNEKINWLKIHNRNPLFTKMADKIDAKTYIEEILGTTDYTVPTLGVWDKPEEIDYSSLPEQFVLKCNHDFRSTVIIQDKSKIAKTKIAKFLSGNLKDNYFWPAREWVYKNIKPRILAEQFLGENIYDYRIWTINGKAKFIVIDVDKTTNHVRYIFDPNWNQLNFSINKLPGNHWPRKPDKLNKMVEIAEKLAQCSPFLRVDFYVVDQKIYVGELTFYPIAGLAKFYPADYNLKIGDLLHLPKKTE
ncbi:TPA: glycosyl transferase [Streptococcus suis]|nr:glycosyl transferase [Streptococcus suis]